MATLQQQRSELDPGALAGVLEALSRRLRFVRWVRFASRGVLIGIALSLAVAIVFHFDLLPLWLPLVAAIPLPIVLGLTIGSMAAFRHPIVLMDAARLAETRLGLKERLSSALEFGQRDFVSSEPQAVLLLQMQQQDALTYARTLKPTEAVPLRLPWESKALIPAFVLLVLALVLPTLPIFTPPAIRLEHAIVQKTGEKLIRTARVIEKQADAQHLDATHRTAQKLQALGQRMSQGHIDKKKAMVQMSQLSQEIAKQQAQSDNSSTSQETSTKSLADAGRELSQSLHSAQNQKGANQKTASSTSGTNSSKSSSEMQKAAQSMQQNNAPGLSEHLRQMANQTESGKQSAAERQQTADNLRDLATSLKGTSLSETAQHAQAASDALNRGDTAQAVSQMRQAADAAEREAQKAAQASQAQQDRQGQQSAQSALQKSQDEMAGAQKPGDIKNDSGQQGQQPGQGEQSGQQGQQSGEGKSGQQSGQGQQPGQGQNSGQGQSGQQGQGQQGSPGNMGGGEGSAKPGPGQNTADAGNGSQGSSQKSSPHFGAPHPLTSNFDPGKNPRNGKIYLGHPTGQGSAGKIMPATKGAPGSQPTTHPASSVPYTNYVGGAKKSAETAMDQEDIPPAYKSIVRHYYDSLQPVPKSGATH